MDDRNAQSRQHANQQIPNRRDDARPVAPGIRMPGDPGSSQPGGERLAVAHISKVGGLLEADQVNLASGSELLQISHDLALAERLERAVVGNVEKLHLPALREALSQRRTVAVRRSNS